MSQAALSPSELVFNGATSWVAATGRVPTPKKVELAAALVKDVPAVTAPKKEEDVVASLRKAASGAEGRGRNEVAGLLGKVADMFETGQHPDKLREVIADARYANKKNSDFAVTRLLLAASKLAHHQTGDAAGITVAKAKAAEPIAISDERTIADALKAAQAKFGPGSGKVLTASATEPKAIATPAGEKLPGGKKLG